MACLQNLVRSIVNHMQLHYSEFPCGPEFLEEFDRSVQHLSYEEKSDIAKGQLVQFLETNEWEDAAWFLGHLLRHHRNLVTSDLVGIVVNDQSTLHTMAIMTSATLSQSLEREGFREAACDVLDRVRPLASATADEILKAKETERFLVVDVLIQWKAGSSRKEESLDRLLTNLEAGVFPRIISLLDEVLPELLPSVPEDWREAFEHLVTRKNG